MIVKTIGFKENKKCMFCDLIAYYELDGNEDQTLCSNHMMEWVDVNDNN